MQKLIHDENIAIALLEKVQIHSNYNIYYKHFSYRAATTQTLFLIIVSNSYTNAINK